MPNTTRCNQTSYNLSRQVTSQTYENNGTTVALENSDNLVDFDTVADDGTPIIYKGNDHRPCGTNQYDENPVP